MFWVEEDEWWWWCWWWWSRMIHPSIHPSIIISVKSGGNWSIQHYWFMYENFETKKNCSRTGPILLSSGKNPNQWFSLKKVRTAQNWLKNNLFNKQRLELLYTLVRTGRTDGSLEKLRTAQHWAPWALYCWFLHMN